MTGARLVPLLLLPALVVACGDPGSPNAPEETPPTITMGDSVIGMVNHVMERLDTTGYRTHDYVSDVLDGVLILDCSYYVKQVLIRVSEPHYLRLPKSSRSGTTALAGDYHDFFTSLSPTDTLWERVDDISRARPGDIIAWKYDDSASTTGHVMIIYSSPQRSTCADTSQHRVYVNDAANSGHGDDTRDGSSEFAASYFYVALPGSNGQPSGVGIGKMWFNTGNDSYYRWSSCSGNVHPQEIAIGRLVHSWE